MKYLRRRVAPVSANPKGGFEEWHEVSGNTIERVICFDNDGTAWAWYSGETFWWPPDQLVGTVTQEKFNAMYHLYDITH